MKRKWLYLVLFLMTSCAGFNRGCASCNAGAFGSDWIVVQYKMDGTPINCWRLHDTSVSNEQQTDGIYWLDPESNHLVHISGWYNRVQIKNANFESAAKLIGIDLNKCQNGRYTDVVYMHVPTELEQIRAKGFQRFIPLPENKGAR